MGFNDLFESMSRRQYSGLTSSEKTIIKVLQTLSELDIEVTVIESMLLNFARDKGKMPFGRKTQDVDCDIAINASNTEELCSILTNKFKNAGYDYYIKVGRRPKSSEFLSVGISIFVDRLDSTQVAKMDITVMHNKYRVPYPTCYNFVVYGQSLAKVFADKVYVCSSLTVVRRPKDVYDLYLLSEETGWSIIETTRILQETEQKLQNFETFLYNIEGMKASYAGFNGDSKKRPFKSIYGLVKKLLQPFINGNYMFEDLIWDGESWINAENYKGTYMLAHENRAKTRLTTQDIQTNPNTTVSKMNLPKD